MASFESIGIKTRVNAGSRYATVCCKCSELRKPEHKTKPCLTVNNEPENQWWKCQNCGWSGNLQMFEKYEKVYKSARVPKEKPVMYSKEVSDWLESKHLSSEVALRRSLWEVDGGKYVEGKWIKNGHKEVVFPYYLRHQLVNAMYRRLHYDEAAGESKVHFIPSEKGTERCFWGLELLDLTPSETDKLPDGKGKVEIIITEGQTDAMTWDMCQFKNVLSIPDGAPALNAKNLDKKLEFATNPYIKELFKNVTRFYIAMDGDEAGQFFKEKLVEILGKTRCYIITYPPGYKDSNEVYGGDAKKGLDPKFKTGIQELYENAKPYPMRGIISIWDVEKEFDDISNKGFPKGFVINNSDIDRLLSIKKDLTIIVTGVPGHGKALDINTEIPTLDGWKLMKDIQVGDILFDENGDQCSVINATDIMYDHSCYEMSFSDGSKIIADADHQWFTSTVLSRRSERNAKKNNRIIKRSLHPKGTDQSHLRTYPKIYTTKEISETLHHTSPCGEKRNNHVISISKPVKYETKNLLIPPYVLGAWLGDGHSAGGGFTSNDVEIIDKIRSYGFVVNKLKSKYGYGIAEIKGSLRKLNVLDNKHIPEIYLRGDIDQRLDLLKGLMDTDGHVAKDNVCEFVSIKKKLAYQVFELINSLGIKCVINEYDAKLYGRVVSKKYRICFTPNIEVFNLSRKTGAQKRLMRNYRMIIDANNIESVPVKCIQVDSPNSLFLCTKAFIATHNSTWLRWYLSEQCKTNTFMRWALHPPEVRPRREFAKIAEVFMGKHLFEYSPNKMNQAERDSSKRWVSEHFKIVNPDKRIFELFDSKARIKGLQNILGYFKHLKNTEGIFGYVIDPWNKLEHERAAGLNETDFISRQLDIVTEFNEINDLCGFIVAHPTKIDTVRGGNFRIPTLYDISGSANWFNKPNIGICVYRKDFYNTKKKNDDGDDIWSEDENAPSQIIVSKMKEEELGKKGRTEMYLDARNGNRFTTKRPAEFPNESKVPEQDELPF